MALQRGVLSYPIPAYQNVPIEAQFYRPSRFVITAITLGLTTIVTTSVAHNYVINMLVKFIIPNTYGCRQLNEQQGYVLSIPSTTQVEVMIFSIGFDPYIASTQTTQAQILAIGDKNNGTINDDGRQYVAPYIPGSFRNISPK
jgi:hypothetical protein